MRYKMCKLKQKGFGLDALRGKVVQALSFGFPKIHLHKALSNLV